jgi:K+-sensing histidine kinase KdpD
VSKSRQGRRAVLPVRNTGPLVPDSAIERLFEPFRRLDPRRTSYKDGLGLSIVRAIATAHGATITAEPFLDGGVAIEVTFPPSTRAPQRVDEATRVQPTPATVARPTRPVADAHPVHRGRSGP